jgi:hypothetical protein
MNRKERRAVAQEAFQRAAATLQPAWEGDTATRMAAIQDSMRIINSSELKVTHAGLAQLYADYVYIAEQDKDFPPELLEVLRRLDARVQEILQMHERRSQQLERLARDMVLTYEVWDKHMKR